MLSEKIAGLRRQAGWSQEELAERLDVSRQSVSKWESGASQPEVDKIVALSRLFGVSTDALLRDDVELPVLVGIAPQQAAEPAEAPQADADGLHVMAEGEVFHYLENRRQCAPIVALGVGLCAACPAPMMALMGLLPKKLAVALGVAALLGMIAVSIAVLMSARMRMSKYDYVDRKPFALTDAMREAIQEQKQDFLPTYRQSITFGVVLCVLSPVPVSVGGILRSNLMVLGGVAALLLMVAAALYLFVRDRMILDSFGHILKRADRSQRRAEQTQRRTEHARQRAEEQARQREEQAQRREERRRTRRAA